MHRNRLVTLFLAVIMSVIPAGPSYAGLDAAYSDGKTLADTLTQGGSSIATDGSRKASVPQFTPDAESEALANPYYGNPGNIGPAGDAELQTNEAGRLVTESFTTRPQYNIDPETDPLITTMEEVVRQAQENYTECQTVQICIREGLETKLCTENLGIEYFTCNAYTVGTPTVTPCWAGVPVQAYALNVSVDGVWLYQTVKVTACNDNRTFDMWTDVHDCTPGWAYVKVPADGDGLWHPLPDHVSDWWSGGCNLKWYNNWYKGGCTNNCAGSTDPNCTETCTYQFVFSQAPPYYQCSLAPCPFDASQMCKYTCTAWRYDSDYGNVCVSWALTTPVPYGTPGGGYFSGCSSLYSWHWTKFSFSWKPARCTLANQSTDDQCGPYVTQKCTLTNSVCVDAGCKTFAYPCNQICLGCWNWRKTYACSSVASSDCQALRDQGCYQSDSGTCVAYDANNVCIQKQYTYTCPVCLEYSTVLQCGGDIYCMDGSPNCYAAAEAANQDFSLAASHIGWLEQVARDFDADGNIIFKGETGKCREDFAQTFRDCCDLHGILVDSCAAAERELQSKRQNGLCHYVGRYCSSEIDLGFSEICIEYTDSFCCFKSMLSRIIHEQGRPQLGIGWGSAENPDCRGFAPFELQRIDFSAIDFTEYYNHIQATFPVQGDTLDQALVRFQEYYDSKVAE